MSQTIFYQSSMPRAGSTLLQNIIGQNPNFYVTPTSPMVDLMLGTRIGYNASVTAPAVDQEDFKKGFYNYCKEGFKGYVSTLTNKPYILDKSRWWGPNYNLLKEINPNPKIIVMVRDLRSIFSSMEKKFRQNPDYEERNIKDVILKSLTTFQRVEGWTREHPIGNVLNALYQSLLDKTAYNFLFIKYEDLCTNPEPQLNSIYNFLNIEPFKHNFQHIPQITIENDEAHGIYGDHIIRNNLEMLPNDSIEILGKDANDWIYSNYKWYFDMFNYNK